MASFEINLKRGAFKVLREEKSLMILSSNLVLRNKRFSCFNMILFFNP